MKIKCYLNGDGEDEVIYIDSEQLFSEYLKKGRKFEEEKAHILEYGEAGIYECEGEKGIRWY